MTEGSLYQTRTIQRPFLLTLAIFVLLAAPVCGQVKNTRKLSRIPPPSREALLRRLELFVQYDRAHDYNQQFALLSRSYIERNKFTQETYVEFKGKEIRGTLLTIKIHDVVPHLKDNHVEISVSAQTVYKGSAVTDTWIFTAYLQDGEWYFDYKWVDI